MAAPGPAAASGVAQVAEDSPRSCSGRFLTSLTAGPFGVPTAPGTLQLTLVCPQNTMVASLQGLEKGGAGDSGALCISASDSLALFTLSLRQIILPQ